MENENFTKYLTERYEKQMEYYKKACQRNQARYKKCQWTLIVLSAVTPVFATLNGTSMSLTENHVVIDVRIFLIVISTLVAVLTTGLKTFNYQELWVRYRSTYEQLKPEIYYYNFNVGQYGSKDVDKEALFVSRVESILDVEHKNWPPVKKSDDGDTKNSD